MMRVLQLLFIFDAICLGFIRFIHIKKTKISAKLFMSDGYDLLGPQQDGFKSGFVTILGNPNVGKSSLLNTILKQKICIVSSKPQTTRHRILGVLTEKSHQIIFSDTPGMILSPNYLLQETMMDTGAVGDADVILLITDVYSEEIADKKVNEKLKLVNKPIIVVINKVDLLDNSTQSFIPRIINFTDNSKISDSTPKKNNFFQKRIKNKIDIFNKVDQKTSSVTVENNKEPEDIDMYSSLSQIFPEENNSKIKSARYDRNIIRSEIELINLWHQRLPQAEIVLTSMLNNKTKGVNCLLDRILHYLPEGPKYFPDDEITNRDERFFSAEIIREAIFSLYKDEIPYSCEVEIESFVDKKSISVIEANIVVNKDSQKAILIGRSGTTLKLLGTDARIKLESFLERKVFLNLHIKVDEDWRYNEKALKKYGYKDSDFG